MSCYVCNEVFLVFLVINDHSLVCFNCALLPTRDEEALQNAESLR